MHTTLNKIRENEPCREGWARLLRHLGKTHADDDPLSLITILDSNGLDDALWCLRAVNGHERDIRLYAVWCARQVQHLMVDARSIAALDVAERCANGGASSQELRTAMRAARVVYRLDDPGAAAAKAAHWVAASDASRAAYWVAPVAVDSLSASAAAKESDIWYAAREDANWDSSDTRERAANWKVGMNAAAGEKAKVAMAAAKAAQEAEFRKLVVFNSIKGD